MHSHHITAELLQRIRQNRDYELFLLRRQNKNFPRLQSISAAEAADRGITRFEPKPIGESE